MQRAPCPLQHASEFPSIFETEMQITRFNPLMVAAALALSAGVYFSQPTHAEKKEPPRAVATFAAGCYWCIESDFDKVKGVVATVSGFMGGHTRNPTYRQVTSGGTGHLEVLRVIYDPTVVTYQKLLNHFWVNVDPLDDGGQFCDRGDSYRPAIFVHDDTQHRLAKASKAKVAKRFSQRIAVQIRSVKKFTRAPDYHQNYYRKKPYKYQRYRTGCGRDQRLKRLWGSPKSLGAS